MVRMPLEHVGHPLDANLIPNVDTFDEFAAAPDILPLVDWLASDESDYLSSNL